MTGVWPLRFREQSAEDILFCSDAGDFFRSDAPFLERYATDTLKTEDVEFLERRGLSLDGPSDPSVSYFANLSASHLARTEVPISYRFPEPRSLYSTAAIALDLGLRDRKISDPMDGR